MKAGRNDPCPCGSGKKYKHCCYATDSVKHEEPVVEADAAEEPEDEETEAIEQRRRSQRKDRSRFGGEVSGTGANFRPRQTRSSQRGS